MSLKEEIKNILSRRIQEYNTSVANKFNIRVEELENMWNNLELDRPKTPIEQYEYKKYACSSSSEVLDMLRKYGVAILPGVLDSEECKSMFSGMWDFLETITGDFDKPISRDNPESWKGLRKLYPSHSMLIQHWGIGHAEFIWKLRQNPKIVDIFSKIWNVVPEDLLVSFDGASFHMPPEKTGFGWFRGNEWMHTDQSYTRNGFESIQAWVTAVDVKKGDATLKVLESSHALHEEFRKEFKITEKSDWFAPKSPEHIQFYKNCKPVLIECPAGSMVFWDSRTIHSGQEALRERAEPNIRCIAYICMTPRSRATTRDLQKKQEAFTDMRTTNHYPHKPKLFAKTPHTYGQPIPQVRTIPRPTMTKLGLRLAGF